MNGDDRGPGVLVPPPLLVAAILAAAWAMRSMVAAPLGLAVPALGNVVFVAALVLVVWAIVTMARAGTDPRPDRPDKALIEGGPFRFSRNPVYLSFVLVALGFALRWGDLWGWLAVVAAQQALDRVVAIREEPYLRARFGAAYADYAKRVRRWV
jgi:protein-S-isoprenylcysteine O-methyltransferase Ste14